MMVKTSRPELEVIDGGKTEANAGAFTAADYVQLAAMGHRSVVVMVGGDQPGEIVVRSGMAWWARDTLGDGVEAFRRLLLAGGLEKTHPVDCRPLQSEVMPRNVTASVEAILLDAAKALDDRRRGQPSEPMPRATETGDLFMRRVNAAVESMLVKDYPRARELLQEADDLRPGNPTVKANLIRLRALGFGP